jgi:hypothetical protein
MRSARRDAPLRRIWTAAVVFVFLAIWLVLPTNPLQAKDRRGATVRVGLKTGASVQGELILVREDSLLIRDRSGRELAYNIGEIMSLSITGRRRFPAAFVGFVAGVAVGYAVGANPTNWPHAEETLVLNGIGKGLLFGGLGALAGSLLSMNSRREDTRYFLLEGMTERQVQEALALLRKKARNPD